ncbi:MAG: endonuclease domain-containing protein [Pseudolabrys sp.]|nr:endonuclease domain-containing protein [Pseudolabrys sp.]
MASRVLIARKLRREQTDAERKLWFRLRDRRLNGLKFRRQMPIKTYVVDFCCESARLIVELDGGQHDVQSSTDAIRTAELESFGYVVLRFWNNDVLTNIDGVVAMIVATATQDPPHPNPLPNGEREQAAMRSESNAH